MKIRAVIADRAHALGFHEEPVSDPATTYRGQRAFDRGRAALAFAVRHGGRAVWYHVQATLEHPAIVGTGQARMGHGWVLYGTLHQGPRWVVLVLFGVFGVPLLMLLGLGVLMLRGWSWLRWRLTEPRTRTMPQLATPAFRRRFALRGEDAGQVAQAFPHHLQEFFVRINYLGDIHIAAGRMELRPANASLRRGALRSVETVQLLMDYLSNAGEPPSAPGEAPG
jgi:hypothetical protein